MKRNRIIYAGFLSVALLLGPTSCKDELDIKNPNEPTLLGSVVDEAGFISFAQGVTYNNGFARGANWLGNSYFSLPWGYHELMADNVGASAANNQITNIGQPASVNLNGTTILTNPTRQINIIRVFNNRASTGAGNNVLYYQWSNMYALNNACNQILANVDRIPFSGDKATRINTIKAWSYWWKAYAYSAIGSLYVAGVIVDDINSEMPLSTTVSKDYVSKEVIMARADYFYNQAKTILLEISPAKISDYEETLGALIPGIFQTGNGGILTPAMWIRNISTMQARNILVSKLSPFVNSNPASTISKSLMTPMTPTDWNSIINLTNAGIQPGDYIFTARSTETASTTVFSATSGNVAANTSSRASSSTFKISERFLQNYKTGDVRFENNFNTASTYTDNYVYSTRYSMINAGAGKPGVRVLANRTPGEYEVVIAGSWEENALMAAEANIRLGNIETGLGLIDDVRTEEGAGIAAVAGTGLTLAQALTELVSERRVTLIFRGLSFYDSRRWGWSYATSLGGGGYNKFVRNSGTNYPNATINYDFVDFWDIPADEIVLNPPSANSAPVVNPNY
jgi:hypothetical protein